MLLYIILKKTMIRLIFSLRFSTTALHWSTMARIICSRRCCALFMQNVVHFSLAMLPTLTRWFGLATLRTFQKIQNHFIAELMQNTEKCHIYLVLFFQNLLRKIPAFCKKKQSTIHNFIRIIIFHHCLHNLINCYKQPW